MTEQSSSRWGSFAVDVLPVVDAVRWCAWLLAQLVVQWGSVLYAVQVGSDWTPNLPRPRTLRNDLSTGREIRRGLAQLDAYLSATARADRATQRSEEEVHHPYPEGADG